MAREFLDSAAPNRALSRRVINDYARALNADQWHYAGGAFAFDDKGRMIDGQHRCHAIIQSGVPMEVDLITGLSEQAWDVMDRGRRRTLGDALHRRGIHDSAMIGAIITQFWRYERGGLGSKDSPSIETGVRLYYENSHLVEAAKWGRTLNHSRVRAKSGLFGALWLVLRAIDEEDAHTFFDLVMTDPEKGTGPYALQNVLIKESQANTKHSDKWIFATALKAWNHFRNQAIEVQALGFRSGERFPEPL